MSEFPLKDSNQNENTEASANDNTEKVGQAEASEEAKVSTENAESTIFAKHVYNTKRPVKKGSVKRILTCVIAVVLCIAIAGSIFLVNKLMPSDTGETPSADHEKASFSILKSTDIIKPSTVEIDGQQVEVASNIASINFYNKYEGYTVTPYYEPASEKDDSASSSSASSSTPEKTYLYDVLWQINGIDKDLTVSKTIESHINSCLTMFATREFENTFDTMEECFDYYGLTVPTRLCVVKFNDGTEPLEISIGSQIATGDANYLHISGSDKIYIVVDAYIANFDKLPIDFADKTIVEKIEQNDDNASYFNQNGDLARFDYIKMLGRIFGDDVVEFRMNKGASADYMPYVMMSPYTRPASESYVENILAFAQNGLDAISLYTFKATEENKDICGLNDPNCVIEMQVGDYRYKLVIGGIAQEGTTYLTIMVEGKQQIFSIDASKFNFVTSEYEKMFNSKFVMENIITVKNVTLTNANGSHKYELNHVERAANEGVFDTQVKYQGKDVDVPSFKAIYQRVLAQSLLEFVTEAEKNETVLTVKFEFIDDYPDRVVEFTKIPTDRYHYIAWVDGIPLGEVLATSVDDVNECLEKYLKGETIIAP